MINELKIHRGTKVVISVKLKFSTGEAFDLTGYTVNLIIKNYASDLDENALLTKAATVSDPATGEGVVTLSIADTLSIKDNGKYFYKIEIDNGSDDVQYPVISKVAFEDA